MDNSLTLIGVQIKRANANTSEDLNKMQARFHLVKCSFAHTDTDTALCPKCLDLEILKNIYANQISIILSLDEAGSFSPFTSSKKYFKGTTTTDPEKLNLDRMLKLRESTMEMRKVSTNFFKPLISKRIAHAPDILISKSLWDDKYVNLTKVKLNSDKEIKFVSDGFVHRQFCISIKGWRSYELLFPGDNENFEIAQRSMTPEGLSKSFITTRKEPKFIRKLLYDLSLTFPLYSDELRQARGENSWLDQLNEAVKKSKKSSEKKISAHSKN